ncbi:flagellar biosynthesis protein FlhA [uncultured Aquimonas sp.]|uniref:flagellar biosynthesis protein FlhA n=1 Tax=uncultured Aquimonas sp. TaxID=385483 RepID=UPI00086C224B|nr:flagellar biosynthesis protein FlhA [uncultured Aquimonas sp.]ODU44851.1 MAG: flagellar biosynthesis protein FlhA [Xanthomonadaceae bacterium SCN 69-123]
MAPPATASRGAQLMGLMRQGLGAPLIVLAMMAMIVVPLPPLALDVLFSFNIAISLVILLAVLYVQRPLEFSIFPSILLLVTLLRLALNVASTRVVLLHGHEGPDAAGKVIESFAAFVIGGNFAVGFVVFAILTIINFVVVTKGAGRVSEVSARFILDSLPGKQMAIDADLNAGLLSREEAIRRREEVREESDFYGSMDGASKFIRGDAIAGILILFINLIGGFAIGMAQHGLSAGESAEIYTLLTIGDGLVAQIPGLLISTAVAMLVTRVSRSHDMSGTVMSQVFGQHKALAIAAALLGLVGLVPGMPNFAFLSLAAVLGYAAWVLYRRSIAPPPAPVAEEAPKPAAPTELSWDDLSPVDSLGLEVGYRLIPLVDRAQGGELMARIKGVRRKLTQELGFLIPPVHIRDNLEFSPGAYRILLHGVPIGAGDIHPDRELALNPGRIPVNIDGVPTRDPAFGLDALWISPSSRAQAEALGLTVVDPATVMATHVSHLVRQHAPDLLGHEEVQQLLSALGRTHPKLVEDLTPRTLPLSVIVRVLQNLLTEKVPIRQLRRICESLLEHGPNTQDAAQLTAAVRAALGRFIVQEINGLAPELPVYTLAPPLERVLQESVSGNGAALEPGLAERMHQSLVECVKRQEAVGEPAVLLVPGPVRSLIAKLTRTGIPELYVLAYHEVPDDKKLKLVGNVG